MKIKTIVACRNANGEPDLYFVKVDCTSKQYENGEHYKAANLQAEREGYDAYLAYDENDSAGRAMLPLFKWESATTITA
jgi:hypothetical protein